MSSPRGLPRSHHTRDPVYTEWSTPPKFYSPDLSRKYYPSQDNNSLDSGSLQLKHRKTGSESERRSKEPKSLKDVFSRFADTTSLHAMPYANRASRLIAKLMWALIFVVATAAWIFHSYYLIRSYASFETTSSVRIVYEPINYPSITLCNINPARLEAVEQYASEELLDFIAAIAPRTAYDEDDDEDEEEEEEEDEEVPVSTPPSVTTPDAPVEVPTGTPDPENPDNSTPEGADATPSLPPNILKRRRKRADHDDDSIEYYEYDEYTDLEDFNPFSIDWLNYQDVVNDYSDIMQDPKVKDYTKTVTVFKELMAAIPDYNRTQMAHQLKTMMISCSYDGLECNARNFSRQLDIDYGLCWTFNSFFTTREAAKSARSGSSFGLDLVMYIQEYKYIQGLQLGRGLRLDVHPFGTMPFVMDNGLSVAPGQQAYLGLRVLNQTRLGGRYGPCDDDDGSFVAYNNNTFSYSIEGCINTCLDRTIATQCGCYRRTQRQYYNSEDLKKGFCKTVKETNCSRKYTDKFSAGELNCGCHQACGTVDYETVYSYDTWPDSALWFSLTDAICLRDPAECNYLKSIDEEDRLEFLRSNFIHLKVFYRDLNVQSIMEQPSYGFIQFGSDLGGAIGLWIGASLITIFEFIELFLQLCNFCCRKEKYRKRKQQQRANQNPPASHGHKFRDYILREDRPRPHSDVIARSPDRSRHGRP